MADDKLPDGLEYAPADWWIEDAVTRQLRDIETVPPFRPMTDAHAKEILDRLQAERDAWLAEVRARRGKP